MKKLNSTLFALFFCYSSGVVKFKNNPPNVILIISDDQGWGDLSLNGNLDLTTPNIDRLEKPVFNLTVFMVSPYVLPPVLKF